MWLYGIQGNAGHYFRFFYPMVRTKAQFGVSNKYEIQGIDLAPLSDILTVMELTIFHEEISFDATESLRNMSGFTEIFIFFLAKLKSTLHSVHMLHKGTTTTWTFVCHTPKITYWNPNRKGECVGGKIIWSWPDHGALPTLTGPGEALYLSTMLGNKKIPPSSGHGGTLPLGWERQEHLEFETTLVYLEGRAPLWSTLWIKSRCLS